MREDGGVMMPAGRRPMENVICLFMCMAIKCLFFFHRAAELLNVKSISGCGDFKHVKSGYMTI